MKMKSQAGLALVGGEIFSPLQEKPFIGTVIIDDGKITGIESSLNVEIGDRRRIDCSKKWIVPGFIDVHVHLREPGFEWKETIETGVRAAQAGGYTTICCMPNTSPAIDHAEVAQFIRSKAEESEGCQVLPIGAVTKGREGRELAPLYELREAGCVAFSDDGDPVWDSGVMRRALEIAKDLGVPICCHEEDKALSCCGAMDECGRSYALGIAGWPAVAEEVMIARDIELARATGGHVHICHVSTARGALLIERAKSDGIQVTAEVTPHHLLFSHDDVDGVNTNFKMSPPLRSLEDVHALRSALAAGVIDCIACDHAPHDRDSKSIEFEAAAMGIVGLQTNLPIALQLVTEGVLTRERAMAALSTSAAEIFRLHGGVLKTKAIADVAIVDPDFRWNFSADTNCSKSVNSPLWGSTLMGAVPQTVVKGKLYENSAFTKKI